MDKSEILKLARTRMSEAVEWDQDNRENALDDLENLAGRGQWPDKIREEREKANRPCLTLNRLPQFLRQVTGDIRKLNPAIKVSAGDGAASDEVADIYEGLVRQIEYASDGPSVYETAAESAAACGIGHWRVLTEYVSETSFDQEIRLAPIHNPFSVYWDPEARMSTREDADFCFITDMMKGDDFDEEYSDATRVDLDHDGTTDGLEHWHNEGHVVVAEYFWKEPERVEIGLLESGEVVEKPTAAHYVIKKRKALRNKVMWAKISGEDILEGPIQLPCKHIPVVAVTGEEMQVGEDVVRTSVVRYAKDAQRMYNYWSSAQTETIALQPKAPFLVSAAQIAGLETMWNQANDANRPYLVYNPDPKAPLPQRIQPPVISQGAMTEVTKAADDMKATTGIYDAGLGNQSNEKSGVAIRQRQLESDISTSIYTDNLQKSVAHCGRIIVDMIPKVYDTARTVQVVGVDETQERVPVNQPYFDGAIGVPGIANNLAVGKYDVQVSVGPSYTTQRQEAAETLMEFMRVFPAAAAVSGDLLAKSLDFPGSEALAARLEKMLPPGVAEKDEPTPEEAQQEQARQKQEQQQQQIAMTMQQAEVEEKLAGAAEAKADAAKAAIETEEKRLELAIKNGQLDAAIQQAVARALQGAIVPQGLPPQRMF